MASVGIGPGHTIHAYGFADLVAEKFRALLQQPLRKRNRRQDVYDLAMLSARPASSSVKADILESLRRKSRARGIEPTPASMSDPEIKSRAGADYLSLQDEIPGPLPDFEIAFTTVLQFYHSLPWAG